MKRSSATPRVLALAILVLMLAACYKNPVTGRSSLVTFSQQEEANLGLEAFQAIKQETPQSNDPAVTELVDRVGRRIASSVNLPYAQWEFVAFRDETANAFCLPGGKVGIYTGILPITKNDAGLATVIGHEVAHAVARHGGERMSQALAFQFGGVALSVALRDKKKETLDLALGFYGAATTLGVVLPYSRKHELEADYMGLIYMARAGYDPREAVEFWERFKAYGDSQGGQPPEFLSTHPMSSRRIKELEKHMPEAVAIYEGRQ